MGRVPPRRRAPARARPFRLAARRSRGAVQGRQPGSDPASPPKRPRTLSQLCGESFTGGRFRVSHGYRRSVARALRTLLPNGLFHVNTVGVDGTAVFRDDVDCVAFLRLLADVVRRYRWRVDALCLLTTHYHLVVAAKREDLSDGMKRLNGVHAQRFNIRHKRSGHLFGDRFGSRVIESDAYYATVLEYVRQNPVKAGLVEHADEWPWTWLRAAAQSRKSTRSEHLFVRTPPIHWVGYGPGRTGRSRRPRAQPEGHHGPAAAVRADLRDRALRLGEVQPRLRHDLRGRSAAIRREPLGVRAPVPPDDGEARRRLDRRPQPRDLDRLREPRP